MLQQASGIRPIFPTASGGWGVPGEHGGAEDALPGLRQEAVWRAPSGLAGRLPAYASVFASRWVDERTSSRREEAQSPSDRHVIGVALRPTRLRLTRGAFDVFDGVMPAGMLHVTGPSQRLRAEFHAPCDFLHLYVSNDYLKQRQAALVEDAERPARDLSDLMIRDPLTEQLGRTLIEGGNAGDEVYAAHISQTIVMRLVALQRAQPRVSALAKWRLRRVQEHISRHIADPVSLADLAAAAGLSRMHFAAQFRVATGCRPHDYLLDQRIACAKAMLAGEATPLAEVALNVGFQTQSHFSTVFKRITGESPARWRRGNAGGA